MNESSIIIGLCGTSGIGKTLTCQKIIKELRSRGVVCGGFISPAMFDASEKTSIKVQWLESDEERVLMTPAVATSQMTLGKWEIHADSFQWIDEKLSSMQDCDVCFFDEIGPLEVIEGKGWVKALDILDERRYRAFIVTFRPSLEGYFQQRYPEMMVYNLDHQADGESVLRDIERQIGIA